MKRKFVLCLALTMGLSVTAPLNNFNAVYAQEELQTQAEENNYEAIRSAVKSELIGSVQNDSDSTLNETLKVLDNNVESYLSSWAYKENMTEADDLFNDSLFLENSYGARVTESLNRLKKMAIQYHSKSSKYYQDENIKNTILKGLDFIVSYKYNATSYYNYETKAWYFSNWWDEEIGTPKSLVDTIVLMYEEVSDYGTIHVKKLNYPSNNEFEESTIIDTLTDAMNRYIKDPGLRFRWSDLEETGANLLDKVAITIKYASVVDDDARLQLASERVKSVFNYSTSGDGFYPDGSFIQHSNLPYNGSYGYVLLDEMVNSVALLSYTKYPLESEQTAFLEQVIQDNFLPFITANGNVMDSVRGRSVSRKAWQGDVMGANMMGALLQYANVTSNQELASDIRTSLKEAANAKLSANSTINWSTVAIGDYTRIHELANADTALVKKADAYRLYSSMDRVTVDRENWTFTIAPASSRMLNYESINKENTQGYYQGQGYVQLYTKDLNQYNDNYYATVDNHRLSGITTAHQDLASSSEGQSPWVGGSTLDGKNGISGMVLTGKKLLNDGTESGVTAYKSYFNFGNAIVSVGSNITNNRTDGTVETVETIIDNQKVVANQLSVDGEEVLKENGRQQVSGSYAYLTGNGDYQGTGYVFLDDHKINLLRESRTSSWNTVNQLAEFTDYTDYTNQYVSLAVEHGKDAQNDSYQYVTLPDSSKEETKAFSENPTVKVLTSENGIHAVKDEVTGQIGMNFFEKGSFDGVTASEPVSLVFSREKGLSFAVSDPAHELDSVELTFHNLEDIENGFFDENENVTVIEKTADSITVRADFTTKDGQPVKYNVRSNAKPVIITDDKEITVGDAFDALDGVQAFDKEDGAIVLTEENVISNTVDTTTAGSYKVTYEVSDSDGNKTTCTRNIKVVKKDEPTVKPDKNKPSSEDKNKPSSGNKGTSSDTVKTGDNMNAPVLWTTVIASALIAIAGFLKKFNLIK